MLTPLFFPGDKRAKLFAALLFIATCCESLICKDCLCFRAPNLASLVCAFLGLLTVFIATLSYSASLVEVEMPDYVRGELACSLDSGAGCSRCDQEHLRCPQWSTDDVLSVVRTQAKAVAALSAIFSLYAFSAARVGVRMRQHLALYQIEYV